MPRSPKLEYLRQWGRQRRGRLFDGWRRAGAFHWRVPGAAQATAPCTPAHPPLAEHAAPRGAMACPASAHMCALKKGSWCAASTASANSGLMPGTCDTRAACVHSSGAAQLGRAGTAVGCEAAPVNTAGQRSNPWAKLGQRSNVCLAQRSAARLVQVHAVERDANQLVHHGLRGSGQWAGGQGGQWLARRAKPMLSWCRQARGGPQWPASCRAGGNAHTCWMQCTPTHAHNHMHTPSQPYTPMLTWYVHWLSSGVTGSSRRSSTSSTGAPSPPPRLWGKGAAEPQAGSAGPAAAGTGGAGGPGP